MVARALLLPLILLFAPAAMAQYTLDLVPDHDPWDETDMGPRFAVRPGNCMTWEAHVTDKGDPVYGAGISVKDGDGRDSLHRTNSEGRVTIGTETCWTNDHASGHAFQVTETLDGQNASSNRIVHEVMWSRGQVYADAPLEASGPTKVAIAVAWLANNAPMPVQVAHVTFDGQTTVVELQDGRGIVTLDVQRSANLTVSVPVEAWVQGTPGTLISVQDAGPLSIRLASNEEVGTGGGGGGGGGGTSDPDPVEEEAPGRGTPPAEYPPEADPAPQDAHVAGDPGKGIPAPSMVWAVAAVFLIFWSRRT